MLPILASIFAFPGGSREFAPIKPKNHAEAAATHRALLGRERRMMRWEEKD